MERIQLKALGKINLGLDVLGKRENGYHDVRMIMQTVYLYDEVTLEKRQEPGITVSTNLIYLPTDKTNIAYRAAKILLDEFGERRGVAIHLKKHIPVAAGMAGGSADAAAVLFGMNRMFGWKLREKELMERGVTLGADLRADCSGRRSDRGDRRAGRWTGRPRACRSGQPSSSGARSSRKPM